MLDDDGKHGKDRPARSKYIEVIIRGTEKLDVPYIS